MNNLTFAATKSKNVAASLKKIRRVGIMIEYSIYDYTQGRKECICLWNCM